MMVVTSVIRQILILRAVSEKVNEVLNRGTIYTYLLLLDCQLHRYGIIVSISYS